MPRSSPASAAISFHSAIERGASGSVCAAWPPSSGVSSVKSYDSNCTCRLPAFAVLAAMPASSRSASSTSAPSRARKYALHRPARPPPITSTSQRRVSCRQRRQLVQMQRRVRQFQQRRLELRRLEHQRRGRHRTQRRARCGECEIVRRIGTEPCDRGRAEAALAAPHAGARRLLQRRQRGQAVRQFLAQPAGGYLLAAADDGFVGQRAGSQRGRPEQRPERILERRAPAAAPLASPVRPARAGRDRAPPPGRPAGRAPSRHASRRVTRHRRPRTRRRPRCGRHRRSRSPDGRARHRRSAASRQVRAPDRSPVGTRGSARRHRHHKCGPTRGRQYVRSAHDSTPCRASSCADHSTGTPARFRVNSMPMPSRIRSGRGARHGPGLAPGSRARPRRGFHHRQRLHAAGQQFAGKLQVERPAAGDQHAFAGADALRANQRLQ